METIKLMDDPRTSLKMAARGSFYQLPDELLLKIFSYLDIPDLVLNIQHVDSRWKAVVQDISFWRDYVFTFDKQMADKEVILLLKNMPALRALVATRGASNQVIHTLCKTTKFITRLELHHDHKFTLFHLETIAKNLPQIQHLAFPLSWRDSENAMKYSTLIQQFHQLSSLRFERYGFNTENCFFLKDIATECPLLQDIDLGAHEFLIADVISFLEAKKQVISRFAAKRTNSAEIILVLGDCKHLQELYFAHCGESLSNITMLDLPNLKHLGINSYDQDDFSIIVRNVQKSTMSNLLKLDLGSCNLDPVLFENILISCVQLKILILEFCFLPNGDHFQYIGKCTHLEYLDVHNTTITDSAVEIFAEKCTKLKHLDMTNSAVITDLSLQCLMKCTELQTLKLNITQITGHNFILIPLHLTKLRELHIEDCDQLDLQYVQQLQEQMPHLQVHTSRGGTIVEDPVDLSGSNIFTQLY